MIHEILVVLATLMLINVITCSCIGCVVVGHHLYVNLVSKLK